MFLLNNIKGYTREESKSDIFNLMKGGDININNNVNNEVINISDSKECSQNEYTCHNCSKNFTTVATYEMHLKYCVKEGNPKRWDNFGNNSDNNNILRNDIDNNNNNNNINAKDENNSYCNNSDEHIDNHEYINHININADEVNDAEIHNIDYINNEYNHDDNYNQNDSYHSPTVSDQDDYQQHNYNYSYNYNIDIGIDFNAYNYFNEPNLNYEELIQLDENIKHPLDSFYVSMLITEKLQASTISHLSGDSKKCLICFDDFEVGHKIIRLPCFHIFHDAEIIQWFDSNKTCPICRVDIEVLLSKY